MKNLILLLSVFLGTIATAQNWSLVMPNDTLVYEKQDNHQFFTVWVDSTQVNGTNTTYFMNRISPGEVIGNAPDSVICVLSYPPFFNTKYKELTKPQFYGASISKTGDTIQVNFPSNNFILFPNATVGSKWVSDSSVMDTMEVISVNSVFLSIFQTQDSIKVFKYKGQTFTLSKNHGLLSFIDLWVPNGFTYNLVGVQNLGLGDIIPLYNDFSNFNVGDLFVRLTEDQDAEGNDKRVYKHEITSKYVVNDTIIYQYLNIKNNTTGTLKYWEERNPILNAFPNTIAYCRPFYFNGPYNSPSSYTSVYVFRNNAGDIQKQTFWPNDYHLLGYCDTANFLIEFLASSHYAIYQKGLEPILEGYNHEYSSYRNTLIGYIVDGVPHGDTTSVAEIDYSQLIHFYPNPTNDFLNITTEKINGISVLEMYDLRGRLITTKTFESDLILDVSQRSNGVYFVVIKDANGGVLHREKVVIQ